jgi:hypothetical protein
VVHKSEKSGKSGERTIEEDVVEVEKMVRS